MEYRPGSIPGIGTVLIALSILTACTTAPGGLEAPPPAKAAESPMPAAPATMAVAPADVPVLPANWTLQADFAVLGLKAVELPGKDVGGKAAIILQSNQQLEFLVQTPGLDGTNTSAVPLAQIERSGDAYVYRLSFYFQQEGEQSLTLYGRVKGTAGSSYSGLALARFAASFVGPPPPPGCFLSGQAADLGISFIEATYDPKTVVERLILAWPKGLGYSYSFETLTPSPGQAPRDALSLSRDQDRLSCTLAFPAPGTYRLKLYVSTGKDAPPSLVGLVRAAAATAWVQPSPPNWSFTAAARAQGLDLSAAPGAAIGERFVIDLPLPADGTTYSGYLVKGGSVLRTGAYANADGRFRYTAVIPGSGEYKFNLSGMIKGSSSFVNFATGTFAAALPDQSTRRYLWYADGDWKRFPVGDATEIPGDWAPTGNYPLYRKRFSAKLSADLAVPGFSGIFLPKGTAVEFAGTEDYLAGALGWVPARDYPLSLREGAAVLKGGEQIVAAKFQGGAAGYYLAGVLAKEAVLAFGSQSLACPAGSRIVSADGRIESIELKGKAVLLAGQRKYDCVAGVYLSEFKREGRAEGIPGTRITLANELILSQGGSSFKVPALSLVTLAPDFIARILFSKASTMTVDGIANPVEAGVVVDIAPDGKILHSYKVEE